MEKVITLGGFIHHEHSQKYINAFREEFEMLRCTHLSNGLIEVHHFESAKGISAARKAKVETWHFGFRAALKAFFSDMY